MKNQTGPHSKKAEPANPLLNAAIFAAVALAVLPAVLYGAARILHSQTESSAKAVEVEETAPKRSSVAERRAQRLEARKAKETKAQNIHPEITMETVEPFYDGFGMDYDANMEFNGFDTMPPVYMPAPGMMPNPYMAGPGMMPVPNRGNFNELGRMQDAGRGFGNGPARGRGNF